MSIASQHLPHVQMHIQKEYDWNAQTCELSLIQHLINEPQRSAEVLCHPYFLYSLLPSSQTFLEYIKVVLSNSSPSFLKVF